jgi:hypothetical protein
VRPLQAQSNNHEAPPVSLSILTHPVQHALCMQVVHGCSHLQGSEAYGPQVSCTCEGAVAGAEPATHHSILRAGGGGGE